MSYRRIFSLRELALCLVILASAIGFGATILTTAMAASPALTSVRAEGIEKPAAEPGVGIEPGGGALSDSAKAWSRGLQHHEAGQYQQAIDQFSIAIQKNPRHKESFSSRSFSYRALGQLQKALTVIRRFNWTQDSEPLI